MMPASGNENDLNMPSGTIEIFVWCYVEVERIMSAMNRPGFPGEYFICELRLPDHRFRWKHNKLFLLLPE
ncbi:hypothetical protein, partial [Shigella boydii]|uniref:hypothetical protein n=1 Tax=Shigella boydii TaxID=621 RepID=UPI000FF865AA